MNDTAAHNKYAHLTSTNKITKLDPIRSQELKIVVATKEPFNQEFTYDKWNSTEQANDFIWTNAMTMVGTVRISANENNWQHTNMGWWLKLVKRNKQSDGREKILTLTRM